MAGAATWARGGRITVLRSSIPYVTAWGIVVVRVEGSTVRRVERAKEHAPIVLRTRNRDYEQLAREAAPEISTRSVCPTRERERTPVPYACS